MQADGNGSGDEEEQGGGVDHAVVLEQVHAARQAMARGAAQQAAALWLRVLGAVPQLLPELEQELCEALASYTGSLVDEGKAREALWLMDRATQSLPQGKRLWYEQGRLCFAVAQHMRALRSFQRAIELDPGFHAAIDALESVKGLALDRWHFRMLNDRPRNAAYFRALRVVVAEEAARLGRPPVVMDIGTGTGLLALMALEAGAGRVYAVETNPVLCHMARAIIAGHSPRAKEDIAVINKKSQELRIGDGGDLPAPVDIVVTELVDSGLLGEHILPVLRHARASLLRPGGRVIPHSAKLFAMLIESEDIRRRSRILPDPRELLFASHTSAAATVDETYTCESLATLRHTPLTGPLEVMEVDMCPTDGRPPAHASVQFTATATGNPDAVAVWFELDLLPRRGEDDERVVVSTAPGRPQNGWDQGIYFLLPPGGASDAARVEAGQAYQLQVAVVADQLAFQLDNNGSSGARLLAASLDVGPASTPAASDAVPRIGEADLAQLSDTARLRAYQEAVGRVLQGRLQGHSPAHVVEWSGDFSGLGLMAARTPGLASTTILTGTDDSAAALRRWTSSSPSSSSDHACTLSVRRLAFRPGADTDAVASALLQLREELGLAREGTVVLVHDLVEGSGLIRQGALQEALLARDLLLQLPPPPAASSSPAPAAMIPHAFAVMVQLVQCPALLEQNRLDPTNTEGFRLDALDGLGVRKFRELDLGSPEFVPLSAPRAALAVNLQEVQVPHGNADDDNDVLASARVALPVARAGTPHAVAFWFELALAAGGGGGGGSGGEGDQPLSLSTGPRASSSSSSSYRQGAVLLEGAVAALAVEVGQVLRADVVVTLSRGVDVVRVGLGSG